MNEDVWSITALKDYVDKRFGAAELAVEKAVTATALAVDKAFEQNQRAIDKAEEAVEKRLEGMNEFRAQLASERGQYVTVDSYAQQHGALEDKLTALDDKVSVRVLAVERLQSKMLGAIAILVFLTPALAAIAAWLLGHKAGVQVVTVTSP